MSNQRRLGRGLEALLGRSLEEPLAPEASAAITPSESPSEDAGVMSQDAEGQRWLDLGVIEPNPFQPRKRFDEVEIADLTDSIREHGVLQPLVVRRVEGRYELVAGERRLRAAQSAGWERVPVQVRELSDQQTAEIAIVENVQRKDLNAIEKATSFQRYLEQYGCTQDELSKRIQLDRSTIANLIRLLELPEDVKRMVVEGELSQGHARAILSLSGEQQSGFAKQVVKEGLSVRKTEQAVQDRLADSSHDDGLRVIGSDGVSRQATTSRSAQIASLEKELQTALGAKVELKQNAKGKGRITIHFTNGDEFDRLREVLTTPAEKLATGTE